MISKVTKGSGFRGVLMYIAGKQGAEYIGGNVSPNPKEAAREMGTLRQYSKCKTPVWHCSLSLSPEDRRLTNDEFAEIGERFLEKIGLTNHQYTPMATKKSSNDDAVGGKQLSLLADVAGNARPSEPPLVMPTEPPVAQQSIPLSSLLSELPSSASST